METHSDDRLATVGGRIKAVRTALGLTATELAGKIGISRPTFSIWENGHVGEPDEAKLKKLAEFLHVSPEWLIHAQGKPPAIVTTQGGTHVKDRIERLERTLQANEQLPPENIRMLNSVDKSVPEIKAAAPIFDDHHHDSALWTMPREVLKNAFHCDPDNVVIKQARKAMKAADDTPIRRGDYILIDKTRNVIDEPGHYYVADPEGRAAHRATATINDDTGEITVRVEGHPDIVVLPDDWIVMGRAMAVFHALP